MVTSESKNARKTIEINVDGIWGENTRRAVEKFQSDQGLTETGGQLGEQTRAAIATQLDKIGAAYTGA